VLLTVKPYLSLLLFPYSELITYISLSFRKRNRYDWTRFRAISRLDKKFDDTMTEYYKAFSAMCKRICGLKLTEEEGEHKEFTVVRIACTCLMYFTDK
jgi:hypothetical protein